MSPRVVATEKKIKRHINSARHRPVKIVVYLSRQAKKNLEQLRLRLLDRQGKKPTGSQVIENLVRAAAAKEKVLYPAR